MNCFSHCISALDASGGWQSILFFLEGPLEWIFLPDHPLLLEKFQILQMLGLGKLARGWVFSFVAGKELILGRLPQFGVGWVLRHFENFFV